MTGPPALLAGGFVVADKASRVGLGERTVVDFGQQFEEFPASLRRAITELSRQRRRAEVFVGREYHVEIDIQLPLRQRGETDAAPA